MSKKRRRKRKKKKKDFLSLTKAEKLKRLRGRVTNESLGIQISMHTRIKPSKKFTSGKSDGLQMIFNKNL